MLFGALYSTPNNHSLGSKRDAGSQFIVVQLPETASDSDELTEMLQISFLSLKLQFASQEDNLTISLHLWWQAILSTNRMKVSRGTVSARGSTEMSKILIIEDEEALSVQLRDFLTFQRYTVEVANTGDHGAELFCHYDYDLAIIDWELPELSGYDIIRRGRANGKNTLVLMLTARKDITDKELGLDAGADDYLTKPFDLRELLARMRALLRRPKEVLATAAVAGHLKIDARSGRVSYKGQEITLMPLEYAILEYFVRHQDQVVSNDELLNRVWKSESEASVGAVRTYMTRLRKKLNIDAESPRIETIHRVGYRFSVPNNET